MIFMSQSGLADRSRDGEWDRWYLEHLRAMVTAPGISSAQRFRAETPGYPSSLAAYSVASAAVFDDPLYLQVRGFGDWQPLIDRSQYHRNLFDGVDEMPAVGDGERLLVCDVERPTESGGIELLWLSCVGLDRSTPCRGIAVLPAAASDAAGPGIAVYRPVTPRVTGAPAGGRG